MAAARTSKPIAITATARRLAILVYRMLKDRLLYADPGAAIYDQHQRARLVRRLTRRASSLGYGLVDLTTGELIHTCVS